MQGAIIVLLKGGKLPFEDMQFMHLYSPNPDMSSPDKKTRYVCETPPMPPATPGL